MVNGRTKLNELPDLIKESESGARWPKGLIGKVLFGLCFLWSLFQIWYASPFPFYTGILILNDAEARAIHLGFALLLVYILYPAFKHSSKRRVPVIDWMFALIGSLSSVYLYLFYEELSERPGMPTREDIMLAGVGVFLLLEATRRALGKPLMIIASVGLIYLFFGNFFPGVLAHKGASLAKALSHQWLSAEGIFGIALGVSTSFVFLFVLFGSMLERAGAGNYFIRLAFCLLGRFKGGPAKAAILASGLTGLISGSSVANVVTTGTFTIPLMNKVGFGRSQAAAIEAATGINGQIMPPVMGAAAFLMVEYVGISYSEVCKHAFLPAIISYCALLYMVHLEAVKMGMKSVKGTSPFKLVLMRFGINMTSFVIFICAIYYSVMGLQFLFGGAAMYVIGLALIFAYVYATKLSAPHFDAVQKEIDVKSLQKVGEFKDIFRAGLHYLMPVFILIWCLVVERMSPGLSAFWAIMALFVLMMSQRPLIAYFKGRTDQVKAAIKKGFYEVADGMVAGARSMIAIAIATATAGIVVGVISLTGVGLKMTAFVELLSGGNVFFMLVLTALLSLLLGMGLPTTANYILVSTLMAPVLVELGATSGFVLPLIAVHLFVFYFGIMADVTPPVGLASFAAAAVAGADPIRTSLKAGFYCTRAVVLPFFFVYNTHLLLIDVEHPLMIALTVGSAFLGMMLLAAAFEQYMIVRNKVYETIGLMLCAFLLFVPGLFMEQVMPEFRKSSPTELEQSLSNQDLKRLRFRVEGDTITGEHAKKTILLKLEDGTGFERLEKSGLTLKKDDKRGYIVHSVKFKSEAEKSGFAFDWAVTDLELPNKRPPSELLFIPALLLLGIIVYSQKRRSRQQEV